MTSLVAAQTLADLIDRRHSCRAFLPEEVPEQVLREVFTVAQGSASWCNTQPWQVHVTRGAATRQLSQALLSRAAAPSLAPDLPMPDQYNGVYDVRRKESGYALYCSLGIDRGDKVARSRQAMENFRFFGAPHAAIITSDRDLGVYGAVDTGGFVATLLLAAEASGLGAVAQAAVAMYSDVVREQLALPDDRVVVCAVALGFADTAHPANDFRTSRAAVDRAVEFVDVL
jgi:nitroreductase